MTFGEMEANAVQCEGVERPSPLFFFIAIAAIILFALLHSGCSSYSGGKITEGNDIAIGFTVPQTSGTVQIDVLNYISGFRFLFDRNAGITCTYSTTNTVSFFGIYSSSTSKSISIELNPTTDTPTSPDDKGESAPRREKKDTAATLNPDET